MTPERIAELKAAAEKGLNLHFAFSRLLGYEATILELLAERQQLLKIAEAAEEYAGTNFTQGAYKVRDALKEWKK